MEPRTHDRLLDDLNGVGLPMWIKVAVRYGGYAAIAFFLIWFMTSRMDNTLQVMVVDHQTLKFYLRQVCLNTATTESQARGCQPEK